MLEKRDREEGLRALKTLNELIQSSPESIASEARDEIKALAGLLLSDEPVQSLTLRAGEEQAESIQKLLNPSSYEGFLIGELATEMGLNSGIFTELYMDLRETRSKLSGRPNFILGQIDVNSLHGKDITEDFLFQDFSEFTKFLYSLIDQGIDKAYIKIDWNSVKDSREAKFIPGMLKAYSDSYFNGKLKISCAIECTATEYYHDLPKIDGANNAFASGVKWIRKRKE